ncbi:MAG: FAD-binding oxidoreductase [Acidobacteria bacterium]|nr:FAD-binding oxidoreductase [Acidobacteriota bacterium]
MPATRYGRSPWMEGVPAKKRPSHPVFAGDGKSRVVIVGGGLAGAMTAYACAVAGLKPVLLEADRIGSGGSGHASGVFAGEASASFRNFEAAVGRKAARIHFDQTRRAAKELVATVKRLGIRAGVDTQPAVRLAPGGTPVKALRKDADERSGAGLEASWRKPAAVLSATGVDGTEGGVQMATWGVCDPYKLVLGFMAAAARRGAAVFERSPVTRIDFDRKVATVVTGRGSIVAAHVVHCTGEPTELVKALKRHFRFEQRALVMSAALPVPVRKAIGPRACVVTDTEQPPHVIRWTADHAVVVSGADGLRPPERQRDRYHVQRTGQLMYELTRLYPAISGVLPAYGWSMPLAHSGDGGLYAGPHRNFPHQLFALGTSHDPAKAFLASRVLLRHLLGETTADDRHLGFGRTL